MKNLRSSTRPCIALYAALLLVAKIPTTAQADDGIPYYAYSRKALRNDFSAIPAGTPATDAQKLVLSNDLNDLFPFVYPRPTATIDFLADRLAAAKSTGQFAPEDVAILAKGLVSRLGTTYPGRQTPLAVLQAALNRSRVAPAVVTQITAAMTALSYSRSYDSTAVSLSGDLELIQPDSAEYKRANGSVSLDTSSRPTFDEYGIVTDPALARHSLSVQIRHLPVGKYRVSVTTTDGKNMEIGTFGVRRNPPVTADAAQGTLRGYGNVTFSDEGRGKHLPDGLALDRIAVVTVTDSRGVAQFTGSVSATSLEVSTTHNASLHLLATAAAPTVGGTISFFNVESYDPNRNFTLEAAGFPANATLTLSVDGKPAGLVETGPTGKLYVKEYFSSFSDSPEPTDIVNLLPDAVDLSVAQTFTLSDAQGNVLATAE